MAKAAPPPPASPWVAASGREQQREAKRNALLTTAAQMFNERGFHATSLDDIAERKRQGLTRSQAAAVCNVSPSFIRDAESHPKRCSLEKLVLLVQGLGLRWEISGWSEPHTKNAQRESA